LAIEDEREDTVLCAGDFLPNDEQLGDNPLAGKSGFRRSDRNYSNEKLQSLIF